MTVNLEICIEYYDEKKQEWIAIPQKEILDCWQRVPHKTYALADRLSKLLPLPIIIIKSIIIPYDNTVLSYEEISDAAKNNDFDSVCCGDSRSMTSGFFGYKNYWDLEYHNNHKVNSKYCIYFPLYGGSSDIYNGWENSSKEIKTKMNDLFYVRVTTLENLIMIDWSKKVFKKYYIGEQIINDYYVSDDWSM